LGKPASPRTVHWFAHCIARWFAQRWARRGNAYSVGGAGWFVFVRCGRCAVSFTAEVHFIYRGNVTVQA
jgi:hypothetical protein